MKQMPWSVYQMQFPDKAANFPGGEQAFNQQQQTAHDNWAYPGGMGGPRQQNAGIMGLGGFQGGQIRPPMPPGMPPGGWNPQQPVDPPRQDIFGIRGMGEQIGGFGEQLGGFGEQMGGFGETLGGYQDLLGGYGEQLGGFGEQLGGFKDEFSGINDKLQNLEQGISSLTDKFGTQQQQQSPYQQNFGMNPFGSINPYTPFFGGLGMFMRRY